MDKNKIIDLSKINNDKSERMFIESVKKFTGLQQYHYVLGV